MPIRLLYAVSVRCDGCGKGWDDFYSTSRIAEYMQSLKSSEGWTGTYRKCYCPECSKDMEGQGKYSPSPRATR